MDDVFVRGVDVQPVVTLHGGPGRIGLNADVVLEVADDALINDLHRRVVVDLRVLELVARDAGHGGRELRRPVVDDDERDHRDGQRAQDAGDDDRQHRHARAALGADRRPATGLAFAEARGSLRSGSGRHLTVGRIPT